MVLANLFLVLAVSIVAAIFVVAYRSWGNERPAANLYVVVTVLTALFGFVLLDTS